MSAQKLGAPPADVRTEWRRLDDLVDDMNASLQVTSSHGDLVSITRSPSGGLVLNITGLLHALAARGITGLGG